MPHNVPASTVGVTAGPCSSAGSGDIMPVGKIGNGPHFRIYLFEHPHPGKEEGTLRYCVPKGNRYVVDPSLGEEHFDHLDEIPAKMRALLRRKGVVWPP